MAGGIELGINQSCCPTNRKLAMSLQEHHQDSEAEIRGSFLLPPTVSDTVNDVLNYNNLTTNPVIGVPFWLGINSESRIWLHCECTYADGSLGFFKLVEAAPVSTSTDSLALTCDLPLEELAKLGDNTVIDIILMVSTDGTRNTQSLNSIRYSLMFQHPIVLTNYSRWMTDIGENIQHLKIRDLVLPEAHNAGVDQKGAGWPTDQWGACQDDTFAYQLRNGIRALDLRLYIDAKESYTHKEYIFKHGRYHSRRYLIDCLHAVREFAEQNPGEIVILDFHEPELDVYESRVADYIQYEIGNLCIPGSARTNTIGQIRKRYPGRNVIIAWGYDTWLCWPPVAQTWTGNTFNSANQLQAHINAMMANPPTTVLPWSAFAAGYDELGPMRFRPSAAHWNSFFDATRTATFRWPHTKGNLINIDFFAGTGAVDRCISATRDKANKAKSSIPRSLSTPSVTSNSIRLGWQLPNDNENVVNYEIRQNGKNMGTTPNASYEALNLTQGTTYYFEVVAIFNSGMGAPATITATTISVPDTTKPTKPTDLKIVYLGESGVGILRWNAATDNIAVTHYEIYHDETSLGTISSEYTAFPINYTGNAIYKVRAFDAAGNFSDSDPLIVSPDILPPSKPANLKAVDTSVNSITLEWSRSSDNVAVTGYQVYRYNTPIETVNSTVYTDRGLISNTDYHYKVRALDAAGNFTDSDPLTARTAGEASPTKPTNLRILISGTFSALLWDSPTDSARIVSYEIYRNGDPLGTSEHAPGPTQVFFPEDIVTPYSFRVRALDTTGNHTDSDLLTGP